MTHYSPQMGTQTQNKAEDTALEAVNLNIHYGSFLAVKNVSLKIARNQITSFIGPIGLRQKYAFAVL